MKSATLARRFQRMVEITGPNNNQFACIKAQKLEFAIPVCRLILFTNLFLTKPLEQSEWII